MPANYFRNLTISFQFNLVLLSNRLLGFLFKISKWQIHSYRINYIIFGIIYK